MQKMNELLMQGLIVVGFAACFFMLGLLANGNLIARSYAAGIAQGRAMPLDSSRMKIMLQENPEAAKSMGRLWWFGMNHKERRLK